MYWNGHQKLLHRIHHHFKLIMLFFVVSVTGRATPSRTWGWAFSNTQKWIVQGVNSADKARDIRKGHLSGEQKDKGAQENCSATWLAVWGLWWWGSFPGCLGQSLWLRVLPGSVHITQPRWLPVRRILGGGRMCGISFLTFSEFFQLMRVCEFPVP